MDISSENLSPEREDKNIAVDIEQKEVFTAFFRKHYSSLFLYALRFLDEKQAEDVVQDAFMDLWHRRDKIDKGSRLAGFMYRSVYTRSINKLKHMSVANNYSSVVMEIYRKKTEYFSPDNSEVLKRLEDIELGSRIQKEIDSLPERCREVFMLSYLHELKNKEIAEALGISLKTVEAHMYKALRALRSKLTHLIIMVLILTRF